jgi:uncharacterized RDD family membrane protein YckC
MLAHTMTSATHKPEGAASFPRRVAAAFVDAFLLALFVQALHWSLWFLAGRRVGDDESAAVWYGHMAATVTLPCFLYYVAGDASRGGATFGKRLFGIRVAHVYGARISFARATVRTLFKLLPWELAHIALCFPVPVFVSGELPMPKLLMGVYALVAVYLAAQLMTLKKQSVHDLVVGTWVVRVPQRAAAAS